MSIPVHPWSSSAFSSLTKWFSSQACRPSSCPWLTQFMQNIANSSYNKISLSIPTLSEIYILTFVYWQSIKHILYAVSMLVTSVEITQHFKNLISLPVGHSYPLTLSGYISLNPSPFLFRCFSLLQLSLRINAAKKFSKATYHYKLHDIKPSCFIHTVFKWFSTTSWGSAGIQLFVFVSRDGCCTQIVSS